MSDQYSSLEDAIFTSEKIKHSCSNVRNKDDSRTAVFSKKVLRPKFIYPIDR